MGQHTPFQEACTTHLHRAAARTCMLRSRSDHCLSPPCPTTPQRPVSRLTIPSYLAQSLLLCSTSIPVSCVAVSHGTAVASTGRLPMPCRRASAVQEEASDQGAAAQAPKALPGQSQDGGRVSSPLSESMLQILPCTVVPPNLDMGWVGVGGWWEVMDQARASTSSLPQQERALADGE